MKQNKLTDKNILLFSLPLAALVVICSLAGLLTPGFYEAETANWQAQSIGQDVVDLFLIVPCLIISSISSYRNNKKAKLIWAGVMLYLIYTFVLYCFDLHFNRLFVIYCLCLGLSFYSFIYFLVATLREKFNPAFDNKSLIRITGIYFIIIAAIFYFLWLSEVIPAIMKNATPKSLSETGLLTNGVQVLDLAIILPLIFISGIFLLKKTSIGFILAPVILTFFILMDLTIGTLAIMMKIRGIESDLALSIGMGIFALFSLVLLIRFLKSIKTYAVE
jgi:hypothetical protein